MICDKHWKKDCIKCTPVQIIIKASTVPIDFNSPEIKEQLERVKEEIQSIIDLQKVDTSKLHIRFDI